MANEQEEKTFLCTYSFNFQLDIITTLIFGNQFCPYQELLWLHFIVIIMIMIIIIIIIIIIVVDKSQGFPPIPGI